MAARYPIRPAPLPLSATHRSQCPTPTAWQAEARIRYRPLVLKDSMCPILYVRAGGHSRQDPTIAMVGSERRVSEGVGNREVIETRFPES